MSDGHAFDPLRIISTLARHRVDYVLIGAMAARLYGFPRVTSVADITPSLDMANIERLATALQELGARIYTEAVPDGLPFDCSAPMLIRAKLWNLTSDAGRIDIAFRPAGTEGYDDLRVNAQTFEIQSERVLVARLEDILRSKVAADRPKDRSDALLIRAMLASARHDSM